MNVDYVLGKTHSSEYSWHKYWSRKPANVIASYLKALVPTGGRVLDPFSGSGVVLRESARLGLHCSAFDVNPVAVEISRFMNCNVDEEVFARKAEDLISEVESSFGAMYLEQEKVIRFLVHHMATRCTTCNTENVYSKEHHGSRAKRCVQCGEKVSFGLINSTQTVITEVNYVDGSYSQDSEVLARQQLISNHGANGGSGYSARLVNNRRTLTSSELCTADFFSRRNFSILSACSDIAHSCEENELRRALLLLITGSSAQASKLIASRGRLAGGGQAWTIPGFWVPPVHLESNPFIHLRARAKKMAQALREIGRQRSGTTRVQRVSAQEGMREAITNSERFDLVFLDPPYGDSVAFTEFSAIWNAFLKQQVDYQDDISVSDRTESPSTMSDYERSIIDVALNLRGLLTESGKVLLTFNNHDLRAWRALVSALQTKGFSASFVRYHDPAVISTKSQTALVGSYVGDFYVAFSPDDAPIGSFSNNQDGLKQLLTRAAAARGGSLPRSLAVRFGLQLWLELNIDASEIVRLDQLFRELFEEKQGVLYLVNPPTDETSRLEEIVLKCASGRNLQLPMQLSEFVASLERETRTLGRPSPVEAMAIVSKELQQSQLS
jgi:16S rRNA G966 N2-methylase RsmD